MRRFGFLVLAVLLALPVVAQSTIRLGAWNIEHLGNPCSRSTCGLSSKKCKKNPTQCLQKPADLASYIIASEADVLGLEEVSQDLAGRRNQTLKKALDIVKQRTGDTWDHVLFEKADQHQHVGVAWNTSRATRAGSVFRVPVRTNVNGQALWDRRPHAVQFSFGDDQTDIVIIVLHMKANRRENNEPNLRRREAEAKELVRVLQSVRDEFEDDDIVLIGDSNFLDADEGAAQAFVDAGFNDLNDEDEATFAGGGAAPFDRAFVPNDQPEFDGADQTVFDEEFLNAQNISQQTFVRRFSDHFMIFTDIRIRPDDD